MSIAFGAHLKELRKSKTNYSEEQMAKLLYTDINTYRSYEDGDIEPSMYRMNLLTKILNVDLLTLFDYDE